MKQRFAALLAVVGLVLAMGAASISSAVGQPDRAVGVGMIQRGDDYHNRFGPDPRRAVAPLGYQHHCEFNEAVGPACMWDAVHDGNGLGKSFIRKGDNTVTYYEHKVIHALLYRDCTIPNAAQQGWWDRIHGNGRLFIDGNDRVCVGDTTYAIQAGNPGPVGTS